MVQLTHAGHSVLVAHGSFVSQVGHVTGFSVTCGQVIVSCVVAGGHVTDADVVSASGLETAIHQNFFFLCPRKA